MEQRASLRWIESARAKGSDLLVSEVTGEFDSYRDCLRRMCAHALRITGDAVHDHAWMVWVFVDEQAFSEDDAGRIVQADLCGQLTDDVLYLLVTRLAYRAVGMPNAAVDVQLGEGLSVEDQRDVRNKRIALNCGMIAVFLLQRPQLAYVLTKFTHELESIMLEPMWDNECYDAFMELLDACCESE